MRRVVPAAALSGVLLLAACATSGPSSREAAVPAETAASSDEALAPIAGLRAVSGEEVDIETYSGRPTVLWFWAPWCVICAAEGQDVAELAARHTGEVDIVGVAGRGELDAMEAFVARSGTAGMVHVVDLDGTAWSAYGVYGQPAFAFIDAAGGVDVFVGTLGARALAERVAELL